MPLPRFQTFQFCPPTLAEFFDARNFICTCLSIQKASQPPPSASSSSSAASSGSSSSDGAHLSKPDLKKRSDIIETLDTIHSATNSIVAAVRQAAFPVSAVSAPLHTHITLRSSDAHVHVVPELLLLHLSHSNSFNSIISTVSVSLWSPSLPLVKQTIMVTTIVTLALRLQHGSIKALTPVSWRVLSLQSSNL